MSDSFVKRDAEGNVIALWKGTDGGRGPDGSGWIRVGAQSEDVTEFARRLLEESNPLTPSDLDLVRVLEDLVELLVERSVIRFTDLPAAAQTKLLGRKNRRAAISRFSLINDDNEPLI
ncbi:MAG: hypothetical protein RBT55_02015 [Rhodocyclaceae bacterium]|jgi:hypothetical protein|nr:hypothetical protein [Rhodocyclaceae bacterium]